jgi:hypothetical protein
MKKRFGPDHPFSPPTRWLAWCCLVLLLATQGWGQIHRIAHALPDAHASTITADSHAHDWGHTAGSVDCQVLDHLGHADALNSTFTLPLAALYQDLPSGSQARSASVVERWSHSARAPPPQA